MFRRSFERYSLRASGRPLSVVPTELAPLTHAQGELRVISGRSVRIYSGGRALPSQRVLGVHAGGLQVDALRWSVIVPERGPRKFWGSGRAVFQRMRAMGCSTACRILSSSDIESEPNVANIVPVQPESGQDRSSTHKHVAGVGPSWAEAGLHPVELDADSVESGPAQLEIRDRLVGSRFQHLLGAFTKPNLSLAKLASAKSRETSARVGPKSARFGPDSIDCTGMSTNPLAIETGLGPKFADFGSGG